MRRYRKLYHLLRNFDRVKVKVRPHLKMKECYEVSQHRKEVASIVEGLRFIWSANKFKCNVDNIFTNDVSLKEFRDRFEKETPADMLKGNQNGSCCEEASDWLINIYPRMQSNSWPEEYKPLVTLQYPGDVIFVPAGWWHVVLNLRTSVAVTQNFVSKDNFTVAWELTSKEKPDLALLWSEALLKCNPASVTPFQLSSDLI
ncbi:bifunctional arginine demethylase and lysyl-hydroxylase JMJD6-like [Stylophora pistillata]|uniref:bifunctional arginine demethylase and lysyl-hydroxylase JMJD6-like n=1 Tax=Stylophora pistillata TaxID=50429 RepID=UPI000C048333|nr:bifunctional arginine demethylase and lysyl-hydroxylase JMJD6-like [Stylophora pistillata]